MSSSDNIKIALATAYPTSSEKDWKRRSKSKVAGGTERTFENTVLGVTVSTVEDASGNVTVGGHAAPVVSTAPAVPKKLKAEIKAAVEEIIEEIAPDVKPAKPVKAGGSISETRNQMVLKSKWRFTRDVEISIWMDSPAYTALCNSRPEARNYQQNVAYEAWRKELDRFEKSGDSQVLVVVAKIFAGAEIEVAGKIAAAQTYYKKHKDSDGLLVPTKLATPDKFEFYSQKKPGDRFYRHPLASYSGDYEFPLRQIFDAIEPLEVPETIVYVLRDSATGELFGGWKTVREYSRDGQYYTDRATDDPKMVTKLSSAKKYTTSSAVKASIREFTGYNTGLDNNVDSADAYWAVGGEKKMDLPPTWEMVAFDKVSGTEKKVIDVQNWFNSSKRLRVLTQNFGSAVRGVYKKAEGKGMEAIIVFQNRSRGVGYDGKSWDEAARWDDYYGGSEKTLAAIKAATDTMSGKVVREKSPSSIAVAGSLADCFMARMALEDAVDVEVKILDFNTLEEVVEKQ